MNHCICLIVLVLLRIAVSIHIYLTPDGRYTLINGASGTSHSIPDIETAYYICGFKCNFTPMTSQVFHSFSIGLPVKSTKTFRKNPDENIRMLMDLALLFQPDFIVNTHHIDHVALNPSIAFWNGRYIMTYRKDMYVDNDILARWIRDPFNTREDMGAAHFIIKKEGFNNMQEDPRLLVLPNNTLVVFYNAKADLFSKVETGVAFLVLNPDSNTIVTIKSCKVMMSGPSGGKNLTPFNNGNDVYFVDNLQPMKVWKLLDNCTAHKIVDDQHHNRLTTAPWRHEYVGLNDAVPFRGGTPPIMIRGKYLSFFHTVVSHTPGMKTYFMGAVTLCPTSPYRIHAMSEFPIVNRSWYDGKWVSEKGVGIDYVVFPMGLISYENGKYLAVSVGHQDKFGFTLQIDTQKLLSSLKLVGHCSSG
jgi:predicted GH43/DUF377 family glycosyl hydrolase